MDRVPTFTAFSGERLLGKGDAATVAVAAKRALLTDATQSILIFDDKTGQQVDFDLRGSDDEIVARLAPAEARAEIKRPGRPKLGVVPREVTLLPRQWEWLAQQPGGASVTLRRLVDAARASGDDRATVRRAQQASDRIMAAMLGNQPNYEDASRALYAGHRARFEALTDPWPEDLRDYVRQVALPSFVSQTR